MKKLLICLIFFNACGPSYPERDHVEYEFVPYLEAFEDEYGRRTDTIGISFTDDLAPNVAGIAYMFSGSKENNYIEINRNFWQIAQEEEKENLIFHELGHAELLRKHENSVDENGFPVSIMNKYIISPWIYSMKRDELVMELFL